MWNTLFGPGPSQQLQNAVNQSNYQGLGNSSYQNQMNANIQKHNAAVQSFYTWRWDDGFNVKISDYTLEIQENNKIGKVCAKCGIEDYQIIHTRLSHMDFDSAEVRFHNEEDKALFLMYWGMD